MLVATPVVAQPTNEDGIRAMLRGDYRTAARILKPLADDFERPDPIAQFFLAILYQTGKGVQFDMGRACGLFLRSARRDHPFTEQAAGIADDMRQQLGDGASMMCVAEERWRGGPPQSISLGPERQITFTDTSVVFVNGDQETRTLWQWPPEAIILPIQYTPLDVTKPLSAKRQFFQLFQWMPDESANPSSWTLSWALIEVMGDQWSMVTYEKSVTVLNRGARPGAQDVNKFVRIRVNANGEAEFTITGGSSARTEVISSQAKQ